MLATATSTVTSLHTATTSAATTAHHITSHHITTTTTATTTAVVFPDDARFMEAHNHFITSSMNAHARLCFRRRNVIGDCKSGTFLEFWSAVARYASYFVVSLDTATSSRTIKVCRFLFYCLCVCGFGDALGGGRW